jgi:farnesyl diphosphate synthase
MTSDTITAPRAGERIPAALAAAAHTTEAALDALAPRPDGLHARVQDAMRYALFAGGKRLRPFLVLQSAGLFDAPQTGAVRTAAAIEALHTYSLVHDDLPCMDDDDLRRGQPTTHRKFDEATAVLAGDALLTLAFELLSDPLTHASAEVRCALVARLAQAGGSEGMIGGQMVDIEAESRAFGKDETILLQRMKTGALFEFSCEAGAILGQAADADRQRMRSYARDIGLAFQIVDDLIDVTGTAEKAGKQVGKDQAKGKATLVSLYGVEGARAEARRLADHAVETLSSYGPKADDLRALPFFLLDRES